LLDIGQVCLTFVKSLDIGQVCLTFVKSLDIECWMARRRFEMAWSWKRLNAAKKGLIWRGAIVLVAYELLFGLAFFLVDRMKPTGTMLWVMAGLPTLAVLALIAVLARYLGEEPDEFHRQLVVRCLLWGLAAVMTSVAFHGFLQLFGWKGSWPAGVELGMFLIAMGVAKLTYKVQNRVPADADVLVGRGGAR
jgi:hypothetical protein